MKESMKKSEKFRQIRLIVLFSIICILIVIPFIMLVSISLSNESEIVKKGYGILPRGFDLSGYKYIFKNPGQILQSYKITIFFSVVSTVIATVLMGMIAYSLSVKSFKGRSFVSFYLYFTMLFSGGMIPSYILITKYLHLQNTIWVYIIPSLISPWSIFMIRTFFQAIPGAISESARIDGASRTTILFKIVFPLSKPVLASIAVTFFLGKWNEWYTAMLYINNDDFVCLQYLLQKIMNNNKKIKNAGNGSMVSSMINSSTAKIPTETIRMVMAVVVTGPTLLVFPFFQKYFVKGLTVGSVKG